MIITPFLALVLAAFATFIVVLGTVWARDYVSELRAARAARPLRRTNAGGQRLPEARPAKPDPAIRA